MKKRAPKFDAAQMLAMAADTPIREIAEKLGCSYQLVTRRFRELGVAPFVKPSVHSVVSIEELLLAAESSATFSEMLVKLGKTPTGGAFYHYKNRLASAGFDFAKFSGARSIAGRIAAASSNAKAVLRRVRLPRCTLKKSMDLAGVPYKCANATCGISTWLGEPLFLPIHHADGDKTNNRIDNLFYMCPNCHTNHHAPKL